MEKMKYKGNKQKDFFKVNVINGRQKWFKIWIIGVLPVGGNMKEWSKANIRKCCEIGLEFVY